MNWNHPNGTFFDDSAPMYLQLPLQQWGAGNCHLPGQNRTWVKIYHFWPKNDDGKWSIKMFLKFLHAHYEIS